MAGRSHHRRRPLAVSAGALVLALGAQASAETYYVAPGGSDGGIGSQAAPWATLQHAADSVAPGDEVVVANGNYVGFLLSTAGTEAARITFRAEGSGAIIDTPCETGDGISLSNVGYVTIEGFHIIGATDKGIAHHDATPDEPVHGLVIRNNLVEDTDREGMYLSELADSLIEGNVIRGSGQSGETRSHGLYLANAGSDNTIIRGNDIGHAGPGESNGIHINGDVSVGGDGIASGLLIEANILHDNAQNGLNMDGVQDTIVRNNLIYGNATNAIRGYAIDGAEGPRNLVVVNNTIHAGTGWCVRLTEDLGGLVVFDNILMSDSENGGSIGLDGTAGFASASNAVADRFTPDRDDTILSLSEWQQLGYDTGSFLATPAELFVATGTDYQLSSAAPALDVGLASFEGQDAPATDLLGAARPSGTGIDLGAYERCVGDCTYPDGGVGGAGNWGGGSATGGSGASGANGGAPNGGSGSDAASEDDSGCGCHLPARQSAFPRGLGAALAVLAAAARRRRQGRAGRDLASGRSDLGA